MKLEKRSRRKIGEVQKMIQETPMTPELLTYMNIHKSLKELYFQGAYRLVDSICDALLHK